MGFALHTFLLVLVGCGVNIAAEQMVPPHEYEEILNWFYDRAQEGEIELKGNGCMGCRARAFAATGDFLNEEPYCTYEPRTEPFVETKV